MFYTLRVSSLTCAQREKVETSRRKCNDAGERRRGEGRGRVGNAKLDCKMASRSDAGLLYVQEICRLWPFCSVKGRSRSLWQQTGGSQSLPFHFPGCKHPTSRSLASSDSLAPPCNLLSFPYLPPLFFVPLSPYVFSASRLLFGPLAVSNDPPPPDPRFFFQAKRLRVSIKQVDYDLDPGCIRLSGGCRSNVNRYIRIGEGRNICTLGK